MSYLLESKAKTRYRELLEKAEQRRRVGAVMSSRSSPLQLTQHKLGVLLVRLGERLQYPLLEVTDVR